jgi:hypothetical protein
MMAKVRERLAVTKEVQSSYGEDQYQEIKLDRG